VHVTWKEFAYRTKTYCDGWLEGHGVRGVEELKDLIICEQIKRRVPREIKDNFIDKRANLRSTDEVTTLVEE
jgi:hypothetical protein